MNDTDHRDDLMETTSYPYAVFLVSVGVAPLAVRPAGDGTPRSIFVFDNEDVQKHKPAFRRVQAILRPAAAHAAPTHVVHGVRSHVSAIDTQ